MRSNVALVGGLGLLGLGIATGAFLLAGRLRAPEPGAAQPTTAALTPGQLQAGSAPSRGAAPAASSEHVASARPRSLPSDAGASGSRAVASRREQRQRADAIRRQRSEQRAQAAPSAAPPSADPASAPASDRPRSGEERAEFLRRAMREQYFPIARECYQELLDRSPHAGGKVVLSFAIVGDAEADAGGVVDRVDLEDGTTIEDPEFLLCMRESLYSTVFEAPPPGSSETTVVYPIELRPE